MRPYLKSAVYAGFGLMTFVVVLPDLVARFAGAGEPVFAGLRVLALVPGALGAWVYLGCVFDFAARGGTPAFWDAPPGLVVNPWFRRVRNPMYVGVDLMILSRALWLGSPAVGIYAVCAALGFHCFVVWYEEPHLRGAFGEQYESYLRKVPRWLPRLTAGHGPSAPAGGTR